MIKNWIDIVRETDYFDLIEENVITDNKLEISNGLGGKSSLSAGSAVVLTEYEEVYVVNNIPEGFPGTPPTFIAITQYFKNIDETGNPHGCSPAPAQRYGNICFMWAEVPEIHVFFDSYVGSNEVLENHFPSDNQILPEQIKMHREDGFPAMIEMINMSKYYDHGKLNRKGGHAAIRAEYLVASWYVNGKKKRSNGPHTVTIENFQEFWSEGKLKGYKESNNYLNWKIRGCFIEGDVSSGTPVVNHHPRRSNVSDKGSSKAYSEFCEFIDSLNGKTDPFSNTFFLNTEDEFCFMASF